MSYETTLEAVRELSERATLPRQQRTLTPFAIQCSIVADNVRALPPETAAAAPARSRLPAAASQAKPAHRPRSSAEFEIGDAFRHRVGGHVGLYAGRDLAHRIVLQIGDGQKHVTETELRTWWRRDQNATDNAA